MRGLLAALLMAPPPPFGRKRRHRHAPAPDVAWPRERRPPTAPRSPSTSRSSSAGRDNTRPAAPRFRWSGPARRSRTSASIELAARTEIDKSSDLVTLSEVRITKGSFPGASPQDAEQYLATLRAALPKTRMAGLGAGAAGQPRHHAGELGAEGSAGQERSAADPLPHRAVAAGDDRAASRRCATMKEAPALKRVINTSALILQDPSSATYYLWASAAGGSRRRSPGNGSRRRCCSPRSTRRARRSASSSIRSRARTRKASRSSTRARCRRSSSRRSPPSSCSRKASRSSRRYRARSFSTCRTRRTTS